jgi:hypothetical protein
MRRAFSKCPVLKSMYVMSFIIHSIKLGGRVLKAAAFASAQEFDIQPTRGALALVNLDLLFTLSLVRGVFEGGDC